MTITTILFDVGGVIVAPLDPVSVWEVRDELANTLGFSSGQEMWLYFYESEYWMATKTGEMLHMEMWDNLLRPYGLSQPEQQAQFIEQLRAGEGMRPEMAVLIETLCKDYQLGILSNWDDRLELILEEELEIADYFDAILNSHHIGAAKPDEVAFQMALTRLNVRAEEVLFIDDRERNTLVAAELGLHIHTFTDFPALVEDLKQRRLLNPQWSIESA